MNEIDIQAEIKKEFLSEAIELIEQTEEDLLELEHTPNSPDLFSSIFRLVHTIKGSAYVATFKDLADFTHVYETLLGHIRSGMMSVDSQVVDLLLHTNDHLKKLVHQLTTDHHAILEFQKEKNDINNLLRTKGIAIQDPHEPTSGFHTFEEEPQKTPVIENATVPPSPSQPMNEDSQVTQESNILLKAKNAPCVLICDDDKDILDVFETILEDEDYQIVKAHNGKEALEVLKSQDVELVISDLRMPEMDGLEFFKKVRETNKDLPVIMISGHADRDDLVSFIKLGVYDFVDKPFDANFVLLSVKNALRMHRIRNGVVTLANLNFKAYMAMIRYFSNKSQSQESKNKSEESIKSGFDEIAALTNLIIGM